MKNLNVALFVSEFEDPFTNTLCEGAVKAAKERDYNLYIFPGKFLDERITPVFEDDYAYQNNCLFQFVSEKSIDIVIIGLGNIASQLSMEHKLKFLQTIHIPVILISDTIPGYSCVNFKNGSGFIQGLEHLISKHHKLHFGYVSGPSHNIDAVERRQVFEQVMKEHGFSSGQYRIVEGDFSYKSAKVIEELVDEYPEMDALVCGNDIMCYSAYQVLEAKGKVVGKDIAVLGFDDAPYSSRIQPGLTTVKADSSLLGYKAVSMCEQVLQGEHQNLTVDTSFVIRESCGCKKIHKKENHQKTLDLNADVASLNHTLVSISRNILNYEDENDQIYYMILNSLCKLDIQSVYLYTFLSEIEYKKGQHWVKPAAVRLRAYYKESHKRIPDIIYQPMPVYCYPVDEEDIREVEVSKQLIPFDQIFSNSFMNNPEPEIKVVTLLYAGELQYGFLVWDVQEEYFGYVGQLSYQISNAMKTNKLLRKKNKMAAALEDSLQEVQEKNSILEEISKVDELTQIYNRRGFLDSMKRNVILKKHAGKHAIAIYADMNNLKLVNDQFGHEEGDYALCLIGQILRDAIRGTEGIGEAGRVGGDEFCAYIITDIENSEAVLRKRIEDITESLNQENDKLYYVSMSVGMKHFICSEEVDVSYELEQADIQLYEYKVHKRKSILK
jgi:diguanylate cyclase (GGDEF)-like protein